MCRAAVLISLTQHCSIGGFRGSFSAFVAECLPDILFYFSILLHRNAVGGRVTQRILHLLEDANVKVRRQCYIKLQKEGSFPDVPAGTPEATQRKATQGNITRERGSRKEQGKLAQAGCRCEALALDVVCTCS